MSIPDKLIQKIINLKIPVILIPVESTTSDKNISDSIGKCCSDGICLVNCECNSDGSNCICSAMCDNCSCNKEVTIADTNLKSKNLKSKNLKSKKKYGWHGGHGGHGGHHDWDWYSDSDSSSDSDDCCCASEPKKKLSSKKYKKIFKSSNMQKAQFPALEKYIIVFNNLNDTEVFNKIAELKKKNGFKVKHTLLHTVKGCTVTMDKSMAEELLNDPNIQYIEKDSLYSDMMILKASMDTVSQTALWHQTITNTTPTILDNFSSVNCYIIDTGIMASHSEFYPNQVFMAYNCINKSINAQDDNGHGTCVASLVGGKTVGSASRTILHAVKALDSSGSGYVSDIIAGINWIMQNKKPNCIINMSFGGMYSKTLDTVIQQCILANVPIVCSAGNSGVDASIFSPANSSGVYTIGAYDKNKNKPNWSNFGPVLTTFSPGDVIKAAWADSPSSYYLVSGTSFSAPITTGIISRYLSVRQNAPLLQITTFLNKSEVLNEIINPGSINTPNKRIVFNQNNTIM